LNIKRVRKYHRTLNRTTGLIKDNPVVALAMTLPFIIVPAVNLKSSFIISVFIMAATVPCAMIAPLLKDKIKDIYTVPLYSVIAMLAVIALKANLKEYAVIFEELGIYLWLTAVNSIMIQLSAVNPRKTVFKGFKDAMMMCLGFAAVCCFIGAAREVLGNKTIWDNPFEIYSVRIIGVTLPFFGFIMIGFINAFFRSIDRSITRLLLGGSHHAAVSAAGEKVGEES